MEPETKLEAMTYLVSFTYYLLTHYLRLPLSPFSIFIPCLPAFSFLKIQSRNTFLLTSSTLQPQAQSNKPPHIANNNAFLGDVVSTCRNTKFDADAPISAGFYRQEKGTYHNTLSRSFKNRLNEPPPLTLLFFCCDTGTELVYTYKYHETKIILEGSFYIKDHATGKEVKATPGDVSFSFSFRFFTFTFLFLF